MQDRIAKGLATQFEERRIIVWTDPDGELRQNLLAAIAEGKRIKL
jgi:hypothetical protein